MLLLIGLAILSVYTSGQNQADLPLPFLDGEKRKDAKQLVICKPEFNCTNNVSHFLIVDMMVFYESIQTVEYNFFQILSKINEQPFINTDPKAIRDNYTVDMVEPSFGTYKKTVTSYIENPVDGYSWKYHTNMTYPTYREFRRISRETYYKAVKQFTDSYIGQVVMPNRTTESNNTFREEVEEELEKGVKYIVMYETFRIDRFESNMVCDIEKICPKNVIREFLEDMVNDLLFMERYMNKTMITYMKAMAQRLNESKFYKKINENDKKSADDIMEKMKSGNGKYKNYLDSILSALRMKDVKTEDTKTAQNLFNRTVNTLDFLFSIEQLNYTNYWYKEFTDFAFGFEVTEMPPRYVEGVFKYFENTFDSFTEPYLQEKVTDVKDTVYNMTSKVIHLLRE